MAKLTPVQTVTAYTLELSEDELKAVFWLVGKVGGDEHNTYRRLTDSICRTIGQSTGWNYTTLKPNMFSGSLEGRNIQ